MRICIIAAALLVLTGPACAAYLTATPEQWEDINTFADAFFWCGGEVDNPELKVVCDISAKLQDKLEAQGFCWVKRIVIGRPSKFRRGCYAIHEPSH